MNTISTQKSGISFRMIWNIAYSIMLGNLAQTIVAVTDTAFLGRLGEVELGAAAMSGIYYYFFTTIAWGFSIGVQIIIARRLGEKRLGEIGSTMMHGLSFTLLLATLLFGVINLLSPIFLKMVLTSDDVYRVSIDFLSYRGYGVFFSSLNFMFRSFYIGLSKTRSISYSTLLMAIVNIFLDWALIFGTPLNEAMGVQGAAIASVTAEISATIFFIIYTLRTHPIGREHKIFQRLRFSKPLMRNIFQLSIPTMSQKFISYGMWLFFFFMIESMGEHELATTMVVRNIFMIVSIPAFAFGAATNTITSRLIGQGDDKLVIPAIKRVISLSLIISIPIIALLLCAPRLLLSFSTDSTSIINSATPICYLLAANSICYIICMPLFEAVSGTGYTLKAFWIESIALALYVLFIWLSVRVIEGSLLLVWGSETLYAVVLSAVSFLFIRYFNWRKRNF